MADYFVVVLLGFNTGVLLVIAITLAEIRDALGKNTSRTQPEKL